MRLSNLTQALSLIKINNKVIKSSVDSEGEGWITLPCPFAKVNHKGGIDKNPSFGIHITSKSKSHYNCLSCGSKGRLVDLPLKLKSIGLKDYTSILETLDQLKELEVSEGGHIISKVKTSKVFEPDPFELYLSKNPMKPAAKSKQAKAYLSERAIPLVVAEYMDLGFNPESCRISFPIKWLNGDILGYAQRLALTQSQVSNLKSKNPYILDGIPKVSNTQNLNKDFCLLGLEHYTKGSICILVEGLFGLANINKILNCNTSSYTPLAPLGVVLKEGQINLLASLFRKVIIVFDNDFAGASGSRKLQKALQDRGVIVSTMDWSKTDKNDVDDFMLTDLQNCGIVKTPPKSELVKNKMKQ